MTINSRVPMAHFEDGPRIAQPGRNTLDAAIDQRPYQLVLTVKGSGAGELLFRSDMRYKNGYVIRFDGEQASLFRLLRGKRTELASAPAALGTYSLIIAGNKFTLKKHTGGWVWQTTDSAIPAGLRMRYKLGAQTWTTIGRLL